MKAILDDTSPDAEDVIVNLVRTAPVWKRLKMIEELNDALRSLALADLRRGFPQAGPAELHRRLAARLLSRHEVIAAYGWDPEVEGY